MDLSTVGLNPGLLQPYKYDQTLHLTLSHQIKYVKTQSSAAPGTHMEHSAHISFAAALGLGWFAFAGWCPSVKYVKMTEQLAHCRGRRKKGNRCRTAVQPRSPLLHACSLLVMPLLFPLAAELHWSWCPLLGCVAPACTWHPPASCSRLRGGGLMCWPDRWRPRDKYPYGSSTTTHAANHICELVMPFN